MLATRRSERVPAPRFKPFDYGPCPSEPIAQDKYFYADGNRQPIVNQTNQTSTVYVYPPRNITALRFDPTNWQNIPRPNGYYGPWPPTSASQLMNTHSAFEDWKDPEAKHFSRTHGKQAYADCLGKYCWQHNVLPDGYSLCAEENCSHTFKEWLIGASDWEERLELIPCRTSNTAYCHEVAIGEAFEKTKAPVAYIDAQNCGNYVRFCNHSCEHNAVIGEGRVGEERVLVLRAIKRIAAGEQITVDCGEDYFRDGQCKCGSMKCRYSKGWLDESKSLRHDPLV